MGKVKDYYTDDFNQESGIMTDTKLENEYADKLALIMSTYIKGDLDSVEYQIELESLEDWYQTELKNESKTNYGNRN